MGVGPISYREAMFYADELELGPNTREYLWEVIRKVDQAFLRLLNEKLDQQRAVSKRTPRQLGRG